MAEVFAYPQSRESVDTATSSPDFSEDAAGRRSPARACEPGSAFSRVETGTGIGRAASQL
jgi:hypothetical protein